MTNYLKCGYLKCGKDFERKTRAMPGDNNGRSVTNIRDKEENFPDTRTIGYNEEISFGAAICSFVGWGPKVFDEEERLRDPQRSYIPFEELMEADFDGSPLCIAGDDIIQEGRDLEEKLVEKLDGEQKDFSDVVEPQLKPGTILVWHYYPSPEPKLSDEDLFLGNHGKISTDHGEVSVFYKRRKVLPIKPQIDPIKRPQPVMPFTQPPPRFPKGTSLEVLGSLLHAKKLPQLHQIAMKAIR